MSTFERRLDRIAEHYKTDQAREHAQSQEFVNRLIAHVETTGQVPAEFDGIPMLQINLWHAELRAELEAAE